MPYFECTECGQLLDVVGVEQSAMVRECPVCGEATQWTLAFADETAGVSY